MKTNFILAITLVLLALTSCSYKTNMWHYKEAESRTHVKYEPAKNITAVAEAPFEEQLQVSIATAPGENNHPKTVNSEIPKETIASKEKLYSPIYKVSNANRRISGGHVWNKPMKSKKLLAKRYTVPSVDTGDFITDFISILFLGLILFGLAIGLFIGLIAALVAGASWSAWVLGGLIVLALVGIVTA